ncbi:hypothetical protein DERF_014750 [Dermatophagoides farinae]|uniref:Uncharacterized protein n=1 Tax=Dermatophagoides farinae TaxID=6954 RepID=A0A922HMU2_DERFA|nr:hypothetical protein DERF_014750 [Dermatophagoides farinae]
MDDSEFYQQLFSIRDINVDQIWKRLDSEQQITNNDIKECLDKIMFNQEDLSKRKIIRGIFEEMLRQNLIECQVYSFGSTTSGLSSYDSDIDFHVRLFLPNGRIRRLNNKEAEAPLKEMLKIFREKLRCYFHTIFIKASCPIVKLTSFPRNRIKHKIFSCDLNVTNPFGIYNSIFLNFLCQFCPKFQMLTVLLRLWAKNTMLICYEGMNSYTFTMLVLFFFQSEKIFLPIEQLDVNFADHYYETDPDSFKLLIHDKCQALVNDTELSIFNLLLKFFTFYSQFDYYHFVISPRLGCPIRKNEFIDTIINGRYDFKMTNALCLEDPFELERNISKNVSFTKLNQFIQQCEEFKTKDDNFFRNGKNFHKFMTMKNVNLFRMYVPIIPCLCIIRSLLESNDQDLLYNLMVYYGDIITKKFNELYEKKLSIKAIDGYLLIKINEHISAESLKKTLKEYLEKKQKKIIPIIDYTFEMKKKKRKEKIQQQSKRMAVKFDPNIPGPSNISSSIVAKKTSMEIDNDQPKTTDKSNGGKKKLQQQENKILNGVENDDGDDSQETYSELLNFSLVLIPNGENFYYFALKSNRPILIAIQSFLHREICTCQSDRRRKRTENLDKNGNDNNNNNNNNNDSKRKEKKKMKKNKNVQQKPKPKKTRA